MSLKGTPYYGMALDAGASKGDEAEQMAQMIQADDWRSQFEDGEEGFFCPKCGTVYQHGMRCLTCNPIKRRNHAPKTDHQTRTQQRTLDL